MGDGSRVARYPIMAHLAEGVQGLQRGDPI